MIRASLLVSALLALLGGCRRQEDAGPIAVSVVGPALGSGAATPVRGQLTAPAAALIGATGQGLLRFDAAGQVVPGTAARWIVSDEGRSLIFRLPDVRTPGTTAIDAAQIARRIHAAMADGSDNPLKPLLGAISEVDAVTPQVIDIELKAPRPNMLQLFAQPALAMGGGGRGPLAIVSARNGVVLLRPLPDPQADPDNPPPRPPRVLLRGEAAGRAVARFVAGDTDLLLGGRFEDLPVAHIAALPRGVLHVDPVKGLFGLAFVAADHGFTTEAGNRRALAMAIDRDRIGRLLDIPGWAPATATITTPTPEIDRPAAPAWTGIALPDRQTQARTILRHWQAAHGALPTLRIAMPAGPGARLLFAAIASDWQAIGLSAVAVGQEDPADLRLIDDVAPAEVASFYLRAFACDRGVPCTAVTDRLLIEARNANSLAERAVLLAQADALITDNAPFIALGNPVRWSLVSPALDLYRDSPRAIHPLNELRSPLKR
ncbi:ABC transporter substrate-binding protein [Sphingomonas abietis]|uniref:ABC transporter substrate-binding protein n=1 Tax=Sphingomonas abietis TaxID=3012344 RepID=A0ABY7NLW8_9SPHN|nr:ABC transporter substrate-binding protein [Sphingomonas abietis]WBO21628.1 ABC transporter substrate-binding protein [Sphingomonas abietis]